MSRAILFQQWRNANELRKYPFSDAATLTNGDGDTLPINVFMDARVHPLGGTGGQYLSRVTVGETIELAISDESGELATTSFAKGASASNLKLIDLYGRPAGVFVSTPERLRLLTGWSVGDHLFLREQTEFAASVVVPMPPAGVHGISIEDGSFFSKEVVLVGTSGVVLRYVNGAIRVDMVGDPYYYNTVCKQEGVTREKIVGIKTINGVAPIQGRFTLTAGSNAASDTLLRVEPTDRGLKVEIVGQKLR